MESMQEMKVLYVEDDLPTQREMAHFLKRRVGKVFLAADGVEGIAQYELHKPDVIIADILMPRMNGTDMVAELKRLGAGSHIIITTTVDELEKVLQTVDLGISHYIIKPINFDELEVRLEKISLSVQAEKEEDAAKGTLSFLEGRRETEDKIKKELTTSLKNLLGKGPRDIVICLIGGEMEAVVFGSLTTMEKNMLKSIKNTALVEQNRKNFYEINREELEVAIKKATGLEFRLYCAEVSAAKDYDKLIFFMV